MTTFASMNLYLMTNQAFFLIEVSFDISEGKKLSYFQNRYFFKPIFELFIEQNKINLDLYCFQLERHYYEDMSGQLYLYEERNLTSFSTRRQIY